MREKESVATSVNDLPRVGNAECGRTPCPSDAQKKNSLLAASVSAIGMLRGGRVASCGHSNRLNIPSFVEDPSFYNISIGK